MTGKTAYGALCTRFWFVSFVLFGFRLVAMISFSNKLDFGSLETMKRNERHSDISECIIVTDEQT